MTEVGRVLHMLCCRKLYFYVALFHNQAIIRNSKKLKQKQVGGIGFVCN